MKVYKKLTESELFLDVFCSSLFSFIFQHGFERNGECLYSAAEIQASLTEINTGTETSTCATENAELGILHSLFLNFPHF